MGKIFVILGKSASGKDHIYRNLLKNKDLKLKGIVTYSTRPIRKGETEGVDYYFVTEEKLNGFIEKGNLIESRTYNTVFGPWTYATVDDGQFDVENYNLIMIGVPVSFKLISNYFGKEKVVPLYIDVKDDLRLIRSIERERRQENPNYSEICRRFIADEKDFSDIVLNECGIDTVFENNDYNNCIQKLTEYIQQEGSR